MMTKMQFAGAFNIQDFFISHRQMLLRSTTVRDGMPFNIDLIFKGVIYLEMPTFIEGEFIIEEANENEIAHVNARVEIFSRKVFAIRHRLQTYLIGAASFNVLENSLMPDDSSIERW